MPHYKCLLLLVIYWCTFIRDIIFRVSETLRVPCERRFQNRLNIIFSSSIPIWSPSLPNNLDPDTKRDLIRAQFCSMTLWILSPIMSQNLICFQLAFSPRSLSIVSFLRCHRRDSLAISSRSIAFRPALPVSSSRFFFGRPILLPPEMPSAMY
jgi:hypothetical protein